MSDAGTNLVWLGVILGWLAFIILLADGLFQIFGRFVASKPFYKMMEMGEIKPELGVICGAASLSSAILYAIPATSVLGAILATGFLGGAVSIDMRASGFGKPGQIMSVLIGLLVWGGLYFTNPKVHALIPFAA